MCRLCTLVVIATALGMINTPGQAAGSWRKQPMFPDVVKAGPPIPTPSLHLPSLPSLSPGQVLGGCGRGRIRNLQTHSCRGPADIGH
jgi:hypothetical protein